MIEDKDLSRIPNTPLGLLGDLKIQGFDGVLIKNKKWLYSFINSNIKFPYHFFILSSSDSHSIRIFLNYI